MKGYNGVAILSRLPILLHRHRPRLVRARRLPAHRRAARHQGGPVELHDFYVPAGGDIPDRDAEREIRPQARLRRRDAQLVRRAAPAWRAASWSATSTSRRWSTTSGPQAVARRRQPHAAGDRGPDRRGRTPAWSTRCGTSCRPIRSSTRGGRYRNRDWRASDRGRRLDHVWVTQDLVGKLKRQIVLKDARDWPQGSDHVPVCVELRV